MRYCTTCKAETEHDEAFEDRFNPGSMYGHYQVSTGLCCIVCGTDWEGDDAFDGPDDYDWGDPNE